MKFLTPSLPLPSSLHFWPLPFPRREGKVPFVMWTLSSLLKIILYWKCILKIYKINSETSQIYLITTNISNTVTTHPKSSQISENIMFSTWFPFKGNEKNESAAIFKRGPFWPLGVPFPSNVNARRENFPWGIHIASLEGKGKGKKGIHIGRGHFPSLPYNVNSQGKGKGPLSLPFPF